MRIWIVNQYAVPPTDPGGTRHHAFARSLLGAGHEVTVIASSYSHFSFADRRLSRDNRRVLSNEEGVPWLWLWSPQYATNSAARIRNMLHFARRVRAIPKTVLGKPDVIVGSSPQLLAADAARALAQELSVPFVLEVRDLYPETLVELGGISRRHPLVVALRRVESRLYKAAAATITLLPGAAPYLEARGVRGRIEWIPNGVDLSARTVAPPPSTPPFRVLYTGAHGIANSLHTILDAARSLRSRGDISFALVGSGAEKLGLHNRAVDQRLDNVRFSDPVPKERLFEVLQQAHVFVLAEKPRHLYRYGTSMNKLFDYMSAARPVVWATSDPHEPLSKCGGGIAVAAGDGEAMAQALETLADAALEERDDMGRKARAFVEANHDLSKLGDRFRQVLERVV